jgi:hypothetical protein
VDTLLALAVGITCVVVDKLLDRYFELRKESGRKGPPSDYSATPPTASEEGDEPRPGQ